MMAMLFEWAYQVKRIGRLGVSLEIMAIVHTRSYLYNWKMQMGGITVGTTDGLDQLQEPPDLAKSDISRQCLERRMI